MRFCAFFGLRLSLHQCAPWKGSEWQMSGLSSVLKHWERKQTLIRAEKRGPTSHHKLSATTVCLHPSGLFLSLTCLINISVWMVCWAYAHCNAIWLWRGEKNYHWNLDISVQWNETRNYHQYETVKLEINEYDNRFCVSLQKPACVLLCLGMAYTNACEAGI